MKVHLLYPDRDFDWPWALQATAERESARTGRRYHRSPTFDPQAGLPWNADDLTGDLALDTVVEAMARGDDMVFVVSRRVILAGVSGDLPTIRYRQGILRDALANPAIIRELYAIAVEANEKRGSSYLGYLSRFPDSVLRDAIETLSILLDYLGRLRRVADLHAHRFVSDGWKAFFAMLERDLDDPYLTNIASHLAVLKCPDGELLSAGLGPANKGRDYVLHRMPHRKRTWWDWWAGLFEEKEAVYRFELSPRDEAGAQALQQLRNRGLSLAANALGQAADHVRNFFSMLRAELAFYVGCLNLHERLTEKGEPVCLPVPVAAGERRLSCRGLYDIGLSLTIDRRVVGNDVKADGKGLVVITGPNSGGKSTFLRSVGLAQLMMQAGMFVGAEAFCSSLCHGLFTHYKREEDTTMTRGKFDEELGRMSDIVDHVGWNSMVLFNEPFAATNEREGSEIGRQVIAALLEKGIRVLCVTHIYELARSFHGSDRDGVLFLRAAREVDGVRTFKMIEGEPLPTSFGQDLYKTIFPAPNGPRARDDLPSTSSHPPNRD
jgi:hypothetical protein